MENDIEELKQLYYTYEFTDDILFLPSDEYNYPDIFNFVKTGLLTMEEALDALLYQQR